MSEAPLEAIKSKIDAFTSQKRKALSSRFPLLLKPAIFIRRSLRSTLNHLTLEPLYQGPYMDAIIARHSTLLYRKLGDSDMQLQINKVKNLELAIKKLDGLIIPPGQTFSLWHNVGSVTEKKGYQPGMLLSNGNVTAGIGGGLCQLSNFLFWIFLHADTETIERHHHSVDTFPDSGRTLPFGSGATIYHNYLDLKIKNISKHPLQIKLWLTESCLKGQILSTEHSEKKFHIKEANHYFIDADGKFFRFNELYRETLIKGQFIDSRKIITNFAPVAYPLDKAAITLHYRNGHLT